MFVIVISIPVAISYIIPLPSLTSDKIDWATLPTVVGTVSGTAPNYVLKYPDGTMVAVIRKTVTVNITSSWGSLYQQTYGGSNLKYAANFVYPPSESVSVYSSTSLFCALDGGGNTSHAPNVVVARPTSTSNVSATIQVTAIGRWKD